MVKLSKTAFVGVVTIALLGSASSSFAADSLEIRNFVGSINWSNGQISAEVQKNAGATEISGRKNMIIDGGQTKISKSSCKSKYGSYDINWFGKRRNGRFGGYEDLEDLPVLNITLPINSKLIVRDSVIFTDGSPDIGAADIQLSTCGKVTLGNIDGTFALDSRGSADVSIGNTGQIVAHLKGSGDLIGGNSTDVLIQSHGSADIELSDLASLEASIHGSGDIYTGDILGTVEISSHGSGDVAVGEVASDLIYSGHGSGDLEVASVDGESLTISSMGSGDIEIGGGQIDELTAKVHGSGSIEFSGEAQSANLRASGSGDIWVNRVTGSAEVKRSGSADIDIDERG